jgi:hypothetical protein
VKVKVWPSVADVAETPPLAGADAGQTRRQVGGEGENAPLVWQTTVPVLESWKLLLQEKVTDRPCVVDVGDTAPLGGGVAGQTRRQVGTPEEKDPDAWQVGLAVPESVNPELQE